MPYMFSRLSIHAWPHRNNMGNKKAFVLPNRAAHEARHALVVALYNRDMSSYGQTMTPMCLGPVHLLVVISCLHLSLIDALDRLRDHSSVSHVV